MEQASGVVDDPDESVEATGEIDRLAHALRQVSQGGQAADYEPAFGTTLNAFTEKHAHV